MVAFGETADRLGTLPIYIEKDYWVRLILDFLFNRLPLAHPMDIVVEFGFAGESDPTAICTVALLVAEEIPTIAMASTFSRYPPV